MRLWIPALLLLGCFAAATLWQARWTQDLRERRDQAWGTGSHDARGASNARTFPSAGSMAAAPRNSDWARIVVGRPSGARPVERHPPAAGYSMAADLPGGHAAPLQEPDFTMIVRSGQSLSMISEQHYRSAQPELVRALAQYNSLPDPNRIRAGKTLQLPALEKLQVSSASRSTDHGGSPSLRE
jgi:hypothetical protein